MNRTNFGSKLGVLAATAGSAVGLGNIWRFPYEVGENGGAAFILVYFTCIFLIGFPIMLSEFALGRLGQQNVMGTFRAMGHKRWNWIGYAGVLCCFLIMGFYAVVMGWTLEYVYQAVVYGFEGKTAEDLSQAFTDFSSQTGRPIYWSAVCIVATCAVILQGVTKGIERVSKMLMPLLFVLLIILGVRSLTLEGGMEGLRFLFTPDFSKIDPDVLLSAMGQAFFSLSLGMGCMITYGSYMSKKNNLGLTAFQVTSIDTLVALLSAIAVFPAVFAMGMSPAQGPQLVFVTLPSIFTQMPGGYVWAIAFFVLLAIAALTSTISLVEVVTAFFSEEFKMKRRTAAIMCSAIILGMAVLASLSMGIWANVKILGHTFFDLFDTISAKYLMPIGGLGISIFSGWVLDQKRLELEVTNQGTLKARFFKGYVFVLKYLIPLAIVSIFLNELGLFSI